MGTNVKCGGKTGTGPLKVRGGTGQLPDVPVGPAAPPAPPGPAAPVAGRNAGAGAPPAGRAAKSRLTFVPASLAGALGGMAP
ncbi:MAG: hypothetical protein FJZ01_28720, partial [Candidatus Sericytochromatia bacterium]|nr:hypothetical protein [Candidatus Tanganyikabacteria bacterium]